MMHYLVQFLDHGALGPVAIGLSPVEVQQLLGNPQDVGGTPKHRIWKYGPIQLGFRRDKSTGTEAVFFIGLYFRHENLAPPAAVGSEGWFPAQHTSKEDCVRYLEEQGVSYSEDKQLTYETQFALLTRSGARVIFDSSSGEAILDSIQLLREPKAAEVGQT